LADDPDVIQAFGGKEAVKSLPTGTPPTEVLILAAIRTGKSQTAGANAICATQNIDLSRLSPGEIPRVCVVSLTLDLAHATFSHILGPLTSSKAMASLVEGKPTSDSVYLKHPSGRLVEIKVVPLSAAGGSLISRWLAGVVFDEAPRAPIDSVKSLQDARANAVGRLLPGAQMLTIGSPWSPVGPIPELVRGFFGRPSPRLVVAKGTGPQLCPINWPPEKCAALRDSKDLKDQQSYRTDVLAEFLDPEESLISTVELDVVTKTDRPLSLPPVKGQNYVASIDPATRGNSFTLTVLTKARVDGEVVIQVVLAKQWTGSKAAPLSPRKVFQEIVEDLKPYGLKELVSDQWAADALRDVAEGCGLTLFDRTWTAARKLELFDVLRLAIAHEELEVPPDKQLRADLLNIRRRVTSNGVTVDLPRTPDGRHCDYAACLALGLGEHISDPPLPRGADETDDDNFEQEPQRDALDMLAGSYGY
jgi:hypothetical protein